MSSPFKSNRKLGQNFLRDERTIEKICASARLDGCDEVVEIGPGTGALTRFLLKKSARVWAVEKDKRLVEMFPQDIMSDKKFTLIEGDAIKTDLKRFYSGRPLKMVSNLPYGISSPVLRILSEHRRLFSLIVIMVQREVALRIVATPGTRESGSLSLTIQMEFDCEKLFDVSPALFFPRPAVTSSVVRLVSLETTRFPLKSEDFYRKTVRAAFSTRRKTLRNSLRSVFPMRAVDIALESASVDGTRRAETLRIEEFSLISDRLLELLGEKNP